MKIPILEGDIVYLRSVEPEKDYKQWYEVMKDPNMYIKRIGLHKSLWLKKIFVDVK